jgi:hypothetical protein
MPKISSLPEDTAPSTDDYVAGVDAGPTSTKRYLLSRLITLFFANVPTGSIFSGMVKKLWNGWVTQSGDWTVLSSTTISVPTADADLMSFGTRVWIDQTTDKYFYVKGKSGTTITLTGGSEYSLAVSSITAGYFSNEATPAGMPPGFDFTPTYGNLTVGAGANTGRFSINGGYVDGYTRWVYGVGSSVGSNPYLNLPTNASTEYITTGTHNHIGRVNVLDSGTANMPCDLAITNSGGANAGQFLTNLANANYVQGGGFTSTVPMAWTTADELRSTFRYEGVLA